LKESEGIQTVKAYAKLRLIVAFQDKGIKTNLELDKICLEDSFDENLREAAGTRFIDDNIPLREIQELL